MTAPDNAGPLLETKLYIPRRRRGWWHARDSSIGCSRGVEAKLTLVSAPAGFGKTTLLAEWLAATSRHERRSSAWLSLDPSDNQPATFWSYVIAALRTVAAGVGATSLALLQAPQPPPIEAVLTTLLNELSATSTPAVLVLDDYHLIDAQEIHDGVAFLLDHLPPHVHLVIATRADPPLPLARLRARGELAEIRAADLRFTADEAAAYLNEVMGLDLTAADVAALEARTEGWIAALQLAALSMQGRGDAAGFIAGFAGDDRYIVDYLVEEVLQRQPDPVRQFLLRTSILARLSGPLVPTPSPARAAARRCWRQLDRGNSSWCRSTTAASGIATTTSSRTSCSRACRTSSPTSFRSCIGGRAPGTSSHGEPPEAIRHALAAGDVEHAADLMERADARHAQQPAGDGDAGLAPRPPGRGDRLQARAQRPLRRPAAGQRPGRGRGSAPA